MVFRGIIVYKDRHFKAVEGGETHRIAQDNLVKAGAFNNPEVKRVYILNLLNNTIQTEWLCE